MFKILIPLFIFISNASAGTYTTNLNLYKPAAGDTNYVTPFANSMNTLDSYVWGLYTTTGSFLTTTGDGSNLTGIIPSTATGYYPLSVATATYALNGGGSGSGGTGFVDKIFYAETNGVQTQFTLPSTPLANSLSLSKNGVALSVGAGYDYTLSGAVITMSVAPASSTTLLAHYAISDSSANITSSTNTWTAAQIFQSSVTLPSRDKISFGNELSNSSSTTLGSYSTNQTAGNLCVTGSTLTIVSNGGRILAGYSESVFSDTAGAQIYVTYKINGVIQFTPQPINAPAGTYSITPPPLQLSSPTTPGTLQICLVMYTSAGTATFNSGGQFWVQELR